MLDCDMGWTGSVSMVMPLSLTSNKIFLLCAQVKILKGRVELQIQLNFQRFMKIMKIFLINQIYFQKQVKKSECFSE